MTKKRNPPELGKDPAEEVDKDQTPALQNAQGSQQGEGLSKQAEGSNQGRSTGRKGK